MKCIYSVYSVHRRANSGTALLISPAPLTALHTASESDVIPYLVLRELLPDNTPFHIERTLNDLVIEDFKTREPILYLQAEN